MSSRRPSATPTPAISPAKAQDMVLPEAIVHRILGYALLDGKGDLYCKWDDQPVEKKAAGKTLDRKQMQSMRLEWLCLCKLLMPHLLKILYSSPYLPSPASFQSLTTSLLLGEKRWDSLRRIPTSIPGRHITSLDLSQFATSSSYHGRGDRDGLLINGCLNAVLPLTPFLESLILPSSVEVGWSTLTSLKTSKAGRGLRLFKGLKVVHLLNAEGKDPVVDLISSMPNLEVLEIFGMGEQDVGLDWDTQESAQQTLDLSKLRKLTVKGIKNGILLSSLIDSDLSRLEEMVMTSYHPMDGDLTLDLLREHGDRLKSLTYLPHQDWPPLSILPPTTVLQDCPNLLNLEYLMSNNLPNPETFFLPESVLGMSMAHPLKRLTLPRWSTATPIHSGTPTTSPTLLFSTLQSSIPKLLPNLEVIKIDGFTWLNSGLGKAALETGLNGVARRWSGTLRARGVQVVDKEGRGCVGVGMASAASSGGVSGFGNGLMNRTTEGLKVGMKGGVVGYPRRRASMEEEEDDGESDTGF